MHWTIRPACTISAVLAAGSSAWAQAATPAPAAQPLVPDWIWMAAILILVAAAFWYFLRTRRG